MVLGFLAVDNFDFTRKIVKTNLGGKLVKIIFILLFLIFSRDWSKGDMSFRFGVWGLKRKRGAWAHTTVKSDSTSPRHQAEEVRKERREKNKIALHNTFSQTMNKQVTIDVIFQLQIVSYIINVHFSNVPKFSNWATGCKQNNWRTVIFLSPCTRFSTIQDGHKMSHLNFWIVAFSTNFCPIKTDLSGNTVWPQASVFQKLAKMDHFRHF